MADSALSLSVALAFSVLPLTPSTFLLANVWLKRHGHAITEWPEETIGTRSVIREEYIAAVQAADLGNEELLIQLHRRFTPGL